MTSELLCRRVVLKLVFFFLLGKFGRNSEALEMPDFGVIPENKVICQGDRLRLHCANSSMGLTIYSALYGRTEPGHVICPYRGADKDQNYNCGESDVTAIFQTMCEKKSRCKVKVNSALFGDPCPDKHLYLNLVYACELLKRKPKVVHLSTSSSTVSTSSSTVTTTKSTSPAATTSLVSYSSKTIFPTVNVTATPSTVLLTNSTPHTQNPPTVYRTSTEPSDLGVDKAVNTLHVEQAGSTGKSQIGSLGITGALFVWFFFMQDHSSEYVTIFFATAAGALSLALIVGLYVLYRHHESKQLLQVKEEPKLSAYGTTDSKASEEIDPFILGPVKTPPPDYMLEGYNWNRGGSTLPHKNPPNGSVVRTFSAKDVGSKNLNGHSRQSIEPPKYRRSLDATVVRVQRPDGSIVSFNPACASNESPRNGKGRYVNVEDYRKPKKPRQGGKSEEAFFY